MGNPRRGLQALACKLRLFYFPVALVLIAQVLLAYGAPIPARTLPSSADAEPKITKMDPPNWWVGFRPEVMILAAGQNLQGATVRCEYPGVQIARSEVTARGAYLFLWLTISEKAQAGDVAIQIATPAGETSLSFPLRSREPPAGKFQGFSQDDAIYLIMPDRFADGDLSNDPPAAAPATYDRSTPRAYHGGDFRGIQEHLDYLRDLGVTAVWLTPIVDNDNSSPQDYHGYGAVDEYAVEEHFGTQKDLQRLVAAMHAKGLKVILDFVPNHVGPRHPWAQLPPEPDWFHGSTEHHLISSGDFEFLADPHAPDAYRRNVEQGWFGNVLPDLNQENPDVATYFIQNALWWAEQTGIDGYRLDTFPYVSRKFWSDWHQALRQVYPQLTTVGEVMNGDPAITSYFAGGRAQNDGIDSGVNSLFDYPSYFALREGLLENHSPARLVAVLGQDHLYAHSENLVVFEGNHDVERLASGNGVSIGTIKLAFSVVLTMRGVPEIYYGDEIGMSGGNDPDNRHDFPGGFPGDEQNAFLRSGRTPVQQEIFAHVQNLLRLRRDHPALRRGQFWNIGWDQTSYAYARVAREERVLVVCNAGGQAKSWHLSFADTPLQGARKLTAIYGKGEGSLLGDGMDVRLAANEVDIFAIQ